MSAKHRKLYTGRGGAGNAHKLLADDKVYERVLLHEQGIVQAYKEERKETAANSTGRGGAGNIKKKKSGLSDSCTSSFSLLSSLPPSFVSISISPNKLTVPTTIPTTQLPITVLLNDPRPPTTYTRRSSTLLAVILTKILWDFRYDSHLMQPLQYGPRARDVHGVQWVFVIVTAQVQETQETQETQHLHLERQHLEQIR